MLTAPLCQVNIRLVLDYIAWAGDLIQAWCHANHNARKYPVRASMIRRCVWFPSARWRRFSVAFAGHPAEALGFLADIARDAVLLLTGLSAYSFGVRILPPDLPRNSHLN